jgi:hypothetical protein
MEFIKRKTKKDKAKRNFELHGKYTSKHVRTKENQNIESKINTKPQN